MEREGHRDRIESRVVKSKTHRDGERGVATGLVLMRARGVDWRGRGVWTTEMRGWARVIEGPTKTAVSAVQ